MAVLLGAARALAVGTQPIPSMEDVHALRKGPAAPHRCASVDPHSILAWCGSIDNIVYASKFCQSHTMSRRVDEA